MSLPPLLAFTPGDPGLELVSLLESGAGAGLRMVVLREPDRSERALVALARAISPLFETDGALLLHGKHPSALRVAAAAGWGLHCPAGFDLRAARAAIHGPLGASCHNPLELAAARAAGCDYAVLSPIFPPTSKPRDRRGTLGLETLAELASATTLPIYALGGVLPRHAGPLRDHGAVGMAVLGGLFSDEPTPEQLAVRVRAYLSAWGEPPSALP